MADNSDVVASSKTNNQDLMSDGPTLVEANSERGFNYPYYLAIPEEVDKMRTAEEVWSRGDDQRPILVEPHNVGEQVEEFERHLELARQRIQKKSGRYIADELGVPILIPVFPRPLEDPVDWTHMIHMLCAQTMQIDEGPLERVDRQLLAMVDDAQKQLAEQGISVPEEVILNGFSSQAAFVNRFAALHPDRVCSVSAGGINGLAILPQETTDVRGFGKRPMNYPVGVANIEELTGKPFDCEAFRELDQFIYIGSEDHKDALLYPDAWADPELRGIAILTYGEDIHEERFSHCREVYDEAGVNAVFRICEGVVTRPSRPLMMSWSSTSGRSLGTILSRCARTLGARAVAVHPGRWRDLDDETRDGFGVVYHGVVEDETKIYPRLMLGSSLANIAPHTRLGVPRRC